MEALGYCDACGDWVSPLDAVGHLGSRGQVFIQWVHTCGAEGLTVMPRRLWRGFAARTREAYAQGDRHIKRTYNPEVVGRAVQGFRVDLDVVETVDDLTIIWDDQERWNPNTVPTEAEVWHG